RRLPHEHRRLPAPAWQQGAGAAPGRSAGEDVSDTPPPLDAFPPTPRFWGSPRHAALMLALGTMVWGLSFPLMKNWQEATRDCPGGPAVAALTVIALRMFLGLLLFAAAQPRLFLAPTRREHLIGALVGFTNFLGFALQVVGLSWTT